MDYTAIYRKATDNRYYCIGTDYASIWYYHYEKDGNGIVSDKQRQYFDKMVTQAIRKALKNKAQHTDIDTAKLWHNKADFISTASEYIAEIMKSDYFTKYRDISTAHGFSYADTRTAREICCRMIYQSAIQGVNTCISRLFRDSTARKALTARLDGTATDTATDTDGTLQARHEKTYIYNGTAQTDTSLTVKAITDGLTDNQKRISALLMDGYKPVEIAVLMDVSKAYISKEIAKIRKALTDGLTA